MKTCTVSNCNEPFLARGYCRHHYGKWKRYGSPTSTTSNRSNNVQDFWEKVDIAGEDECWLWKIAKDSDGYGFFWWKNKQVRAHRFSWEIINGEIPDELYVLHKCDNPSCVNPKHLFLGTTQDNTKDRNLKCRQMQGEACHFAVLTEEQVTDIREIHKRGMSGNEIARLYNLSPSCIYRILRGETWKGVK